MTTTKIREIHKLIRTIEGYGRNRLTVELENRTPKELNVVYKTIREYSDQIKTLNPEERIQLTNNLILGLEHIDRGKPKDLETYIEVVCFGEPLEQEHVEHTEHRRITSERRYNGAGPEEDE